MSISVEMSRHLSFSHIVHYLVEVALEPLFQTVLCLPYILLLASPTGDTINKVVAFARHVMFDAVFPSHYGGHYMAFLVQERIVPAPLVHLLSGCSADSLSSMMGESFDLTSRSRRFFGLRYPICRPITCMCLVLLERSNRSQVFLTCVLNPS